MTTTTTTEDTMINDGDTVYVFGFSFVASDIRPFVAPDGITTYHFHGVAKDEPRNSTIINTGYAKGTYSWRPGQAFDSA